MSMNSFNNYMYNSSQPSWMRQERLDYCEPSKKLSHFHNNGDGKFSIIHSVLSMFF